MIKSESLDSYKLRYFTKYPNSTIKILEKTKEGFIVFKDNYGVCKTKSSDLLRNNYKTKIGAAINKSEYFTNKSKEIFGGAFDYSLFEYKTLKQESIIICPIHGKFNKTPHAHLYLKQGCQKCGRNALVSKVSKTTEDFINKSNDVHNFKYDYKLTIYTKISNKVKIVCPTHGEYEQIAGNHLQGSGCKECFKTETSLIKGNNPTGWSKKEWKLKAENSKSFDGYKVYILKCWNE